MHLAIAVAVDGVGQGVADALVHDAHTKKKYFYSDFQAELHGKYGKIVVHVCDGPRKRNFNGY